MTGTQLLMIAVGIVRALLLTAMAIAALRLMRRLGSPRPRRQANPALWAGLSLLASAGVCMALIVLRQVILWFTGDKWWFLLLRDPDLVGTLGYALASCLAALGVLLQLRGTRAVLYREEPGNVPWFLGGNGARP